MERAAAQLAKTAGADARPRPAVAELPARTGNTVQDTVVALDSLRRASSLIIEHVASSPSGALLGERAQLELSVRSAISQLEQSSLQAIVDATPVRQVSATRSQLERRAIEAVLQGTEWLSALEAGRRHNPDAVNPHAAVSRWQQAGKVFAIERAGQRLYPAYVFDELGQPQPAVEQILRVLSGYSPFRVASWFESTSSALGGRRPRELLASDPAAVIAAARDHVLGPVHG
ncbi:MAG TPA: hypothetical protein VLA16_20370 [Ideonella sp.]|nr:hypothetical protein [Ideonella sp.]